MVSRGGDTKKRQNGMLVTATKARRSLVMSTP